MDIEDIIKNSKKIYMSESSLETIMDFERVLDSVDLYAFKNWKKGELVEGPIRSKHWVEATFMWPQKLMPDPDGARRLLDYRARVAYKRDRLATPVKVEGYDDFRPGTKKPRIQEDPVWLVTIRMPVEMIEDVVEGFIELEGREIDLADIDDAYNQNIEDTNSMETQTQLSTEEPAEETDLGL